ncbi:MAG: PH domain-containing protein [Clostridia bacterium]|nr:PH domain-containing protein [Clostridia bacterium]
MKMEQKIVWKDRKRTLFGLPLSFTRYSLTEDRLYIDTGFFSRREEEVRLYRILDITLRRSFEERLFGLGTLHCCSADKSSPEFNIKRVKKSRQLRDLLSDLVEKQRAEKRISGREYMGEVDDGLDDLYHGE